MNRELDCIASEISSGVKDLRDSLGKMLVSVDCLSHIPRRIKEAEICNLYEDRGYGNDCFALMENWEQLPIIQRNLLITIARNYVQHPIDGSDDTPFTTNKQTTADLPAFFNHSDAITVLDALVQKMRRETNCSEKAA